MTDSLVAGLRAWADGIYPREAAVELLVRFAPARVHALVNEGIIQFEGDGTGPPWTNATWIDTERLRDRLDEGWWPQSYTSGQERSLFAVAASLLGVRDVDLGDVVVGLDRGLLHLVLAALAHASGSHRHYSAPFALPDGTFAFDSDVMRLPPLVPWPDPSA